MLHPHPKPSHIDTTKAVVASLAQQAAAPSSHPSHPSQSSQSASAPAQVVVTEADCVAKAVLRIKKPVAEVFNAVVQPELMSQYFISQSTGPLVAGTSVIWTFGDFNVSKEVQVLEVVDNERIVLGWNATGPTNRVELQFSDVSTAAGQCTLVKVREKCLPLDDTAVKRVKGQTYGWVHFLFTLKAFVELGVNMRAGSLEPSDMAWDAGVDF